MIFDTIKEFFSYKNMLDLLQQYHSLGWLFGLLLPFMDAFLAVFPLVVIIAVNVTVFGFWKGFLISWLGNITGTLLFFFLLKRFKNGRIARIFYNPNKNYPIMNWISRSGFGPIFIILCFPFTPSFFVNVFAAFSNVRLASYIWAVVLGKFIMIFTISFIGHDIKSLIHKPLKTVILAAIIFVLWFVGKKIEKNINIKHNRTIAE